MLLIAAQAVKLLDLPRFPPRLATGISKLNGGRNGNMHMLKIGGILPRHVAGLKRKSGRRIRLKTLTQDSKKEKENEKAQEITERH